MTLQRWIEIKNKKIRNSLTQIQKMVINSRHPSIDIKVRIDWNKKIREIKSGVKEIKNSKEIQIISKNFSNRISILTDN